jgi:phage terminase large subunit
MEMTEEVGLEPKEDFKYKPTTAFWKIMRLFRNREPLYIVQGGQGASKTISILMILIDALMRRRIDVTICSAEKSKLMDTCFRDFVKILRDWNVPVRAIHEREGVVHFHSGGYCEFIGLDKADIGKGRRRDIIFINEANRVTLSAYADVSQRAKVMICDYNPDALFWLNDMQNDKNFINLTYKDNEYLPIQEVRNIERYRELAYNDDGTIRSEFWLNKWKVYGLGEIGSVEGRVYHWKRVSVEDYAKIVATPIYCVDFGMVDPFAVVELKYYDGNVYVHEINYASENEIRSKMTTTQLSQIKGMEEEGLVTWLFAAWKIPFKSNVICDTNRPSKIISLRKAGWEYAVGIGHKSKILDRIGMISNLNIYYTATSKNIEYEQANYRYATDIRGNTTEMTVDTDNHTIDAISYGIQWMFNQGIIKNI